MKIKYIVAFGILVLLICGFAVAQTDIGATYWDKFKSELISSADSSESFYEEKLQEAIEVDSMQIISKILEWTTENTKRIQVLEEENQLLKDELCKKDKTYTFCPAVIPEL